MSRFGIQFQAGGNAPDATEKRKGGAPPHSDFAVVVDLAQSDGEVRRQATSGWGAPVTPRLNDCSATLVRLSVTRTRKLKVPLAAGIPQMSPSPGPVRGRRSEPETKDQERAHAGLGLEQERIILADDARAVPWRAARTRRGSRLAVVLTWKLVSTKRPTQRCIRITRCVGRQGLQETEAGIVQSGNKVQLRVVGGSGPVEGIERTQIVTRPREALSGRRSRTDEVVGGTAGEGVQRTKKFVWVGWPGPRRSCSDAGIRTALPARSAGSRFRRH